MSERRLDPRRICVVVAIAAILIYFLTTWISSIREASDHAEPIPVTKPNEANRKFHENGMSIIVPPGWRRGRWHTARDEKMLMYASGSGFPSLLIVELLDDSFDDSGHRIPWNFNGTVVRASRDKAERGGRLERQAFIFEIVVKFDDRRYRIAYKSREGIDELPQSVVGYIESFLPPPHEQRKGGEPSRARAPESTS